MITAEHQEIFRAYKALLEEEEQKKSLLTTLNLRMVELREFIHDHELRISILNVKKAHSGIATPTHIEMELNELRESRDKFSEEKRKIEEKIVNLISNTDKRKAEIEQSKSKVALIPEETVNILKFFYENNLSLETPPETNTQSFIASNIKGFDTYFTGRNRELIEIAMLLLNPKPTSIPVNIITGIPGIGKTSLANQFVYRYSRFFPGGVFWFDCKNDSTIEYSVQECAKCMEISNENLDLNEQLEKIKQKWENENILRLVILDNCENIDVFNKLRPNRGGCRILVTARRAEWPGRGAVIAMKTLVRQESIELIKKLGNSDLIRDNHANDLAHELGDLPLAIRLAMGYLNSTRNNNNIPKYINKIKNMPAIDIEISDSDNKLPDYDYSILSKTFSLSYDQLNDSTNHDNTIAENLFIQIACFSSGSFIPQELLSGLIPERINDDLLSRALSRLCNLGLLDDFKKPTLHRLLAEFVKAQHPSTPKLQKRKIFDTLPYVDVLKNIVNWLYIEGKFGYTGLDLSFRPHLRHLINQLYQRDNITKSLQPVVHLIEGDISSSVNEALEKYYLAINSKNRQIKAIAHTKYARMLHERNHISAISEHKQCINFINKDKKIKMKLLLLQNHIYLSIINGNVDDIDDSDNDFIQAELIFNSIDKNEIYDGIQIDFFNAQAEKLYYQGDIENAIKKRKDALEKADDIKDDYISAKISSNISINYRDLYENLDCDNNNESLDICIKYLQSANYYAEKSLAYAEKCGSENLIMSAYENIGVAQFFMGRFDEAEKTYQEVYKRAELSGNTYYQSSSRAALAEVYVKTGENLELGRSYLREAYDIAKANALEVALGFALAVGREPVMEGALPPDAAGDNQA